MRADQPTPDGASSFAGEISLEFLLDADDDPATGTRLDTVYESAGGTWAERASTFKDFGIDRVLKVDGKKNVGADAQRLWAIDVALKTYRATPERRPEYVVILTEGDTLATKSQTDPAVRVEGDVLTFTVPMAMAAVTPGGSYRVQLPSNSSTSSSEMNRIRRGRVEKR